MNYFHGVFSLHFPFVSFSLPSLADFGPLFNSHFSTSIEFQFLLYYDWYCLYLLCYLSVCVNVVITIIFRILPIPLHYSIPFFAPWQFYELNGWTFFPYRSQVQRNCRCYFYSTLHLMVYCNVLICCFSCCWCPLLARLALFVCVSSSRTPPFPPMGW